MIQPGYQTPEPSDDYSDLTFCRGLSDCFACLECQSGGWVRPRIPYILSPSFYFKYLLPTCPPGTLGYRSYCRSDDEPSSGCSSSLSESMLYEAVPPFPVGQIFDI